MDFSQATLLSAAVLALGWALDMLSPVFQDARVKAVTHLVLGVLAAFLVAYSTYGNSQSVNGVKLSDLNVPGLVLIGLMVGGGATLAQGTFQAVSRIGNPYTDNRATTIVHHHDPAPQPAPEQEQQQAEADPYTR